MRSLKKRVKQFVVVVSLLSAGAFIWAFFGTEVGHVLNKAGSLAQEQVYQLMKSATSSIKP